jgi:hypothetical protein
MKTYNKVMQWFWLGMTIFTLIYVTYNVINEGFRQWGMYYIFAGVTLFFFYVRKFMIKRMEKHQDFLNQKDNEN